MTKNTVTVNLPQKCKDCTWFEPEVKARSYHVGSQSMCDATVQCKHIDICNSIEKRYRDGFADKPASRGAADDASQGGLAPAT